MEPTVSRRYATRLAITSLLAGAGIGGFFGSRWGFETGARYARNELLQGIRESYEGAVELDGQITDIVTSCLRTPVSLTSRSYTDSGTVLQDWMWY